MEKIMVTSEQSRRRTERVDFRMPLLARVGTTHVALNDLSLTGAGVQHHNQFNREHLANLTFEWNNHDISFDCRVVRTRLERLNLGTRILTLYRSGLRFANASASTPIVRSIIADRIARAMEEQRVNAYALDPETIRKLPAGTFPYEGVIDPKDIPSLNELFRWKKDETKRYIRCVLDGQTWIQTVSEEAVQPEIGFTVTEAEGMESIERLKRSFEEADAQGRQLIRTLALLSVNDPSDTSRHRYKP